MTTVDPLIYDASLGHARRTTDADAVRIASETFVKDTVLANVSGDNDVYGPPALGKKIRLYFFGYSAGDNVSGVLTQLHWEGDVAFDTQYLVAPGQPYARNIQAGKRYVDGPVDAKLQVTLSASQKVYVNYEVEEI